MLAANQHRGVGQKWRSALALSAVLSLSAPPLAAQDSASINIQAGSEAISSDADLSDASADFAALQAEKRRYYTLAWQLAQTNAPFCQDAAPASGLYLHDMTAYDDPVMMRRITNIAGDIAVDAVANGSPAEQAGLRAGDEVIGLSGYSIANLPPDANYSWMRGAQLTKIMARELSESGKLTLTIRPPIAGKADTGTPPRNVIITGMRACPSHWEYWASSSKASANGERIVFGREFPAFSYSDDLLAAAMAHELAHNVLRHRVWLDAKGRSRRNVRLTEREADRLMPWLLNNAGIAPEAGIALLREWGPRHGGGLFRKRTHDGWDERVDFVAAEIPAIRAALDADGRADWSRHFQREAELKGL